MASTLHNSAMLTKHRGTHVDYGSLLNLFTHSPKVNTVLTAVGLGENKVGFTGAAAIAEAQLLDFDPDTFSLLASVAFRSFHSDLGPEYNPNPKPGPNSDPNSGPTTNPRL